MLLTAFQVTVSINIRRMWLCRHALDALEDGTAKAFGVDVRAEHSHGIQNLKEKISDTLRVFQQTGVLHEREYNESVPASVHGAPRTAEVHDRSLRSSDFSCHLAIPG